MKTTLIISLLSLSAISSYAQSMDEETTERQMIHERAMAIYRETNGNMGPETIMHYKTNYSNVHAAYPDAPANAVPATPSGSYVATEYPPCYKYKNDKGREIKECPGASFTNNGTGREINADGTIEYRNEKSYTGNYPDLHSVYPQAPANAVPARPSTPYTEMQDPPCYKYTNKRGLEVTECPGAQFAPEHRYR